jgi:hypothetical protein
MIRKVRILYCDNEHGFGNVTYPDLVNTIEEEIWENSISSLRAEAKKLGWGRVNGGDYCPGCMESISSAGAGS